MTARPMHTHMPLMAKESDLYYEGCIGGKTGFANEAEHTLVVAAERNGRTYIAVTMRAVDLGINCTDSTALFDYAFNNFDTIDVNGTKDDCSKGCYRQRSDNRTALIRNGQNPEPLLLQWAVCRICDSSRSYPDTNRSTADSTGGSDRRYSGTGHRITDRNSIRMNSRKQRDFQRPPKYFSELWPAWVYC